MKKDNDVFHLHSGNMDEFFYKHYGETHRGLFWRLGKRFKWKLEELKLSLSRTREVRKFLHLDLQRIRYLPAYKTEVLRLRYLDDKGNLVSRRFKVYLAYQVEIMEIPGEGHRLEKGPKGPRTYNVTKHLSSDYYWFGLRRTKGWWININTLI